MSIKKNFLLFFSSINLFLTLTLFTYRLINNDTTYIGLLSFFIVFFGVAIYLVAQTTLYRWVIEAYIYLISFIIIYLIFTGGPFNTGVMILFIYPIFTIFLKGSQKGKYWILGLFLTLNVVIVLEQLHVIQTAYEVPFLIIAAVVYFLVSMIAYFYDRVRIKGEEQTQELAFIDPLTGMYNRNRLIQDIQTKKFHALCIIDIDRFKELTGFYGSIIGDAILKEVADRLVSFQRQDGHLLKYKLHADEFAVLSLKTWSQEEVEQYLRTLNLILESPYVIEDQEISIKVTYGVSLEKKNCLEKADMALRNARQIQEVFSIYKEELHLVKNYENNLHWSRKVEEALESDRIVPFFQAIMNNHNGKIEKFECLVRLIDNDQKIITPYYFLDIAKKTRSYFRITELMLQKALLYFHHLPYLFSINLSMLDLQNKYFYGILEKKIKDFPDAGRLIFEITETEQIQNLDEVKEFIHNIKKLGCQISIDDFGSGYSNFSYLLELDVDFLKIDGSLIKNIHKNANNRIIVENIVKFCKELNLKTIAEYVENQEILDIVKSMGVDYSQGFFLGKPGPEIS